MPVVIDSSVFLAWCMGDEKEPAADAAMQRVADEGGVVPHIWWYEIRNALLMNERRNRISTQEVSDTLAASLALGVLIDDRHDDAQVLSLARRFNLTVYDSAYLEVALRLGMPLATLDRRMSQVAQAIGIETALDRV